MSTSSNEQTNMGIASTAKLYMKIKGVKNEADQFLEEDSEFNLSNLLVVISSLD